MNSHAEIRHRLAAYSGGDLDTEEQRLISEHLALCPACRAELAELQTTLRLIRSTPEVDPPPWLTSRIMANLKEQTSLKRNWLERIFFPLHIKLPIEVMALVTICISGYYLSRTVETGLDQTTRQQLQDIPAQPVPPAALKPIQTPTREEVKDIPAASRPGPKDTPAPTLQAPVPPAVRQEHGTASGVSGGETFKPAPAADLIERAPEAVQEKRKDIQGTLHKEEKSLSANPSRRAAANAPTVALQPHIRIRLKIAASVSASDAVRQAVDSSGGTPVAPTEKQPVERQLTVRIPAALLTGLLKRLEQLGTIVERPLSPDSSGILEVVVLW